MKIRTGFVTNSSSSSFTLILKIDRKNGKPLVWKGYGYEDSDRFGNKYRELNAAISPKKLARSSDTAALAEALKKAVTTIQRTENGDWEDVQVLDDTAKFIKDIKKTSMEDITRISVLGEEVYSDGNHWEQYFEYSREKKKEKYTCQFSGEEYGAIDGGSGGSLRIPDADKAKTVEFIIENGVLQYRGREKQVVIPEGVTKIGKRAFAAWMSLTRVTVPEGVEAINAEAFYECRELERIDLPASVKKIGESAFWGCSNHLTIYAPAGSYAQSYAKKNGIRFEAAQP